MPTPKSKSEIKAPEPLIWPDQLDAEKIANRSSGCHVSLSSRGLRAAQGKDTSLATEIRGNAGGFQAA